MKQQKHIYHGGCLDCISTIIFGEDICNSCQYKKPDWLLRDNSLNKDEVMKFIIERKNEVDIFIDNRNKEYNIKTIEKNNNLFVRKK